MSVTLILGAGVMGTAFSFPLADSGAEVLLVGTHLDTGWIDAMKRTGMHPKLGMTIPDGVTPLGHDELARALERKPGLVVLGVSSPGIPWAVRQLAVHLPAPTPVLLLTKGLSVRDGRITTLADAVASDLAAARDWAVSSLETGGVGGPCIAGELATRRNTSVVIGAPDELARLCADRLRAPYYHVRYTGDVAGVELSAAMKNLLTIGVGTAAGMLERAGPGQNGALMHNPAAALFSQAVTELAYLVPVFGGRPETATGLAGTGDLYVTCQAGRNARFGALLGAGITASQARERMAGETVEGADLALEIGPVIRIMMGRGELDGARLPLTRAILSAVCDVQCFRYTFE